MSALPCPAFSERRLIWADGDRPVPSFCGHCYRPMPQPTDPRQLVIWTTPNRQAQLCPPCQDLWRQAVFG